MIRLTRQTLSRSRPAALVRLAMFLDLRVSRSEDGRPCLCDDCHCYLVELVVRHLDVADMKPTWPPSSIDIMNRKLGLNGAG